MRLIERRDQDSSVNLVSQHSVVSSSSLLYFLDGSKLPPLLSLLHVLCISRPYVIVAYYGRQMTSRPALHALRSSDAATWLRLFYGHFVTYVQDDGVYTQVDYVSQQSECTFSLFTISLGLRRG